METVSQIAQSTPVAKEVFTALSERQRPRQRTDLNRLYIQVTEKNPNMSERDFLDVFKRLQTANVGTLIIGRKNNPNRFAWNYNLKQLASAALGDGDMEQVEQYERKSKRGRPKGSKNKKHSTPVVKQLAENIVPITKNIAPQQQYAPSVQITLQLAPGTDLKEVQALIDLAQSLSKKAAQG